MALKQIGEPSDVIPVCLLIKRPQIGEDHAGQVGLYKLIENHLPDAVAGCAVKGAEDLDHRLDRHMIVEQPQTGTLHQFLAHRHFANSGISDQDDKLYAFTPSA